jgi:hypothetical protein
MCSFSWEFFIWIAKLWGVDTFSQPGQGSHGGGPDAPQGWQGYFSVVAYRPYFNVDTVDVLERIKDSLFPYQSDFVEKTSHNPDMYGPFWICSTLVFVTAALGNFAAYLAHKTSAGGGEAWHYDINKVTYAAIMFYGYVGVIPLGLYFLLKYLGVTSGLVQLWCLYGYSLFVFIPASVNYLPPESFNLQVLLLSLCILPLYEKLLMHMKYSSIG